MKIIECSPFFKENLVAGIKIEEGKKWIDQLHITECNKTFTYNDKPYTFAFEHDTLVNYHKIDGNAVFKRSHYGLSRKPYFIKYKTYPWQNDGIQRNISCSWHEYDDSDIIILSDIDEIIDSRYADRIVFEVKKRGIITVKIYFTLFYLNLFSRKWTGAPDYSYRIFIMTGKYFREMSMTSDQLRKAGEQGKLMNEVHCLEEFVGFHHSWLGDVAFIAEKLRSYAHAPDDHGKGLFTGNSVNMNYLRKCVEERKSIFGPEHELYVDNSKNFLRAVAKLRATDNNELFL